MRDVVLYTLLSLDGVAEEPGDWMFDVDNDVLENLRATIDTQDDVLLGRGTFDYWSGYWPTSDIQPFADFINRTPKHLFTATQPTVSWPNTVLVDAPLSSYLERLKASQGADIGVHASNRLAQNLLAADLVDRLELVVVPTIAGTGRRLFAADGVNPRCLHLASVARSSSGCVFLGTAALHGAAAEARLAPAPRHHALLETARAVPVTDSGAGRSGRAGSRTCCGSSAHRSLASSKSEANGVH